MSRTREALLAPVEAHPHVQYRRMPVLETGYRSGRSAREHGRHWSFLTAPESMTLSILDLKGWQGAGIIAKLNLPAEAKFAANLDIPIVNVSGALRKSPVARVTVDNRRIAYRVVRSVELGITGDRVVAPVTQLIGSRVGRSPQYVSALTSADGVISFNVSPHIAPRIGLRYVTTLRGVDIEPSR